MLRFELYPDIFNYLNQFAVIFRYPGEDANRKQARRAVKSVKIVRDFIREKLGIVDK